MFAENRISLYRYLALIWSVCAVLIAVILVIAYGRNDQLYHVFPALKNSYPLFLDHRDLKLTLPAGTFSQDIENGLRIYSNTHWSFEINFPESGLVSVYITAKGTPVQGIYPLLTLMLDHERPVMLTIDHSKWKTFQKTLRVSAGKHTLTVAFVNDAFQYPEDRNLEIQSLRIGGAQERRSKNNGYLGEGGDKLPH
jgi:hypothetical protein